jgi:hypothetical protein
MVQTVLSESRGTIRAMRLVSRIKELSEKYRWLVTLGNAAHLLWSFLFSTGWAPFAAVAIAWALWFLDYGLPWVIAIGLFVWVGVAFAEF